MSKLFFSSALKKTYREELENLMFFNPQQGQVESGIVESIERYGIPKVVLDGESLRISFENFPGVQTLYALEGKPDDANLVGVMVYVRLDKESIVVLHIGVKEEYSTFGIHADHMLAMKLIVKLRQIASRVNGVRSLTVIYGKGGIRKIPV